MRLLLITAVSIIPLCAVCMDLYRTNRAAEIYRSFSLLFEKMASVVQTMPAEAVYLFDFLAQCNICKDFCLCVTAQLQEGSSVQNAWLYAMQHQHLQAFLGAAECNELNGFASSFGRGDTASQIKLCRYYENICTQALSKRKRKLETERKNALTVGGLCSALIFIALY